MHKSYANSTPEWDDDWKMFKTVQRNTQNKQKENNQYTVNHEQGCHLAEKIKFHDQIQFFTDHYSIIFYRTLSDVHLNLSYKGAF